jgi:endogenous inhibitor of DNA gyrase (YacG/DUF329 family)
MEKENYRYSGPATIKQSYLHEVSVECPKCSKEAFVTVDNSWRLNNAKLKCFHCMFSQGVDELVRYNLIVKRNCDNCGKGIEILVPNQNEKADSIAVRCPYCGVTRTFEPRNEEYRLVYTETGKATDPVFHLPLWFQAEVKGELFWAFNREHLLEIRSYVNSRLRERQTTTHTTMVERLPTFIKQAKNREAILKAIDKLVQKA